MSLRPDASSELLSGFAEKYMWWQAAGPNGHGDNRIIAQVMDIGTYADIERLEAAFGPARLSKVMREAEPGWFSARSWDFWRGRLSREIAVPIAERPPHRTFHGA
ncbi:MAG: hypothetical protein NVSMB26_29560 [Beijerinckiaceae bacterium]